MGRLISQTLDPLVENGLNHLVRLANDFSVSISVQPKLKMRVGSMVYRVRLDVFGELSHVVVLGQTWFVEFNSSVDWVSKSILVRRNRLDPLVIK